ncbi:MAG: TdeIII family type II restriction endonuclease [Limisphaerales bacterium]
MEASHDRRVPNHQVDIQQVLAVQAAGGVARQVVSDLFVLTNDGRELYFEMKTVAPNRDTSKLMKTKILLILALRQGQNAEVRAAMAYNPAGDGRPYTEYAHSGHAVRFLELGADLLVGREFWQTVGDDQTYDELLEIAEDVGTNAAALLPQE